MNQAVYFNSFFKSYFAMIFTPSLIKYSFGVIICKPIGQEDIRTNKAIIQLGKELSDQGIITMAFDYYGTGDSSGKFEDMTLDSCLESIRESAIYLKNQYGVDNIVIIGVRVGALFINEVNKVLKSRSIILWHPVMNGKTYIKEIKKQHNSWLLGSFVKKDGKFKNEIEALGFLYNIKFIEELSNIKLNLSNKEEYDKCLIISNFIEEYSAMKNIDHIVSKHDNFWVKSGLEDALVPIHDIKAILKWIQNADRNNVNPIEQHA